MIAYIKGDLVLKNPAFVIMECAGIGYQIHISLNTFSHIEHMDKGMLHTYLHIKEDAHTLYGFWDAGERSMFMHLIAVSGIGPNTARMILSSLSPQEVREAILTDNVALIQGIKGIGPKSAKRLILELKDKMAKTALGTETASPVSSNTIRDEALSALGMLGFSRQASEKAISKVLKDASGLNSVEELIKAALKNM